METFKENFFATLAVMAASAIILVPIMAVTGYVGRKLEDKRRKQDKLEQTKSLETIVEQVSAKLKAVPA